LGFSQDTQAELMIAHLIHIIEEQRSLITKEKLTMNNQLEAKLNDCFRFVTEIFALKEEIAKLSVTSMGIPSLT
jgi:hypothetical protein